MPPELRILPVLPGRTAGGLFLARYEAGSTLVYSELIVAAATVYRARHVGIWVSHIYVDSAASVAGGRQVWGLPKELAEFTWEARRAGVRRDGRDLCSVRFSPARGGIPAPLWLPAFGRREGRLLHFSGRGVARLCLQRTEWNVPPDSPFAELLPGGAFRSILLPRLRVRINAPRDCSGPA